MYGGHLGQRRTQGTRSYAVAVDPKRTIYLDTGLQTKQVVIASNIYYGPLWRASLCCSPLNVHVQLTREILDLRGACSALPSHAMLPAWLRYRWERKHYEVSHYSRSVWVMRKYLLVLLLFVPVCLPFAFVCLLFIPVCLFAHVCLLFVLFLHFLHMLVYSFSVC